MKKTTFKWLVFAVLVGALVSSCQQDEPIITPEDNTEGSSSSQIIPGQYISWFTTPSEQDMPEDYSFETVKIQPDLYAKESMRFSNRTNSKNRL